MVRSQKRGTCYWKVYEEYVMRKGYLKLATDLAKLCSRSSFLWKVEFVNIEAGYLAEEISNQSVEGMVWLLLTAYSNM